MVKLVPAITTAVEVFGTTSGVSEVIVGLVSAAAQVLFPAKKVEEEAEPDPKFAVGIVPVI